MWQGVRNEPFVAHGASCTPCCSIKNTASVSSPICAAAVHFQSEPIIAHARYWSPYDSNPADLTALICYCNCELHARYWLMVPVQFTNESIGFPQAGWHDVKHFPN
jgi:hypothetical protein